MSCVLETLTEVELIQRKKYLLHQIDKIDRQLNIIKNDSIESNEHIEPTKPNVLTKIIKPNESNKIVKNIKIKINVKKSNLK